MIVRLNLSGNVYHGILDAGLYTDNRMALFFVDTQTHETIAKATIHVPALVNMEYDRVVIKDYSENEGMMHSLLRENLIHWPEGTISLGYTEGKICQLTDKCLNHVNNIIRKKFPGLKWPPK